MLMYNAWKSHCIIQKAEDLTGTLCCLQAHLNLHNHVINLRLKCAQIFDVQHPQ